jgi:hypothetical protein
MRLRLIIACGRAACMMRCRLGLKIGNSFFEMIRESNMPRLLAVIEMPRA